VVICGQLAAYMALMGNEMDWLRWFTRKVMWSIFHISKSEASAHTWLAIRVEPGPTFATTSPTDCTHRLGVILLPGKRDLFTS